VEWSATFRDWSIKYHSRSQTFTVNERNSNNKSLKERLKNEEKYQHISDRWNGPNGAEECCPFLRLKGLSKRAIHDELVAVLQENAVSYSSATRVTRFCREVILGLNSEASSSSPKDDDLNEGDEVNEAILLALSDEPFSSVPSVRQIARRISVPKALDIVGLSILCISQSDIRHLHWVPHTLSDRQKANRVVDPTSRPPVIHPASRIRWGYTIHISP
jgi:hypothetical protein